VALTRRAYRVSERYACRVLGQWRGTQRYLPMHRTDDEALTEAIIALAIEMAVTATGGSWWSCKKQLRSSPRSPVDT
jgi:hypothetical protein